VSKIVQAKPSKPSPDFPMFAHNSGKWAKKIKGQTYYFGRWDAPDKALAEYQKFMAKRQGGPVLVVSSGKTVRYCCNLFLTHYAAKVESGEKRPRTFADLKRTCARMVRVFGPDVDLESLSIDDFARFKSDVAATWNPVAVGNEITRAKSVLNWLAKNKHTAAIDVGPDFRKPPRIVARRYRRTLAKKMYSSKEIRAIMDEAGVHLRAMILLGINCGYQNADCETLTIEQATLATQTGWLDVPRSKTEVDRRAYIWKETRLAIERSLARRHASSSEAFFVLPDGKPFSASNCDIAKRFRSARDYAGIRQGGYSWLRKTFETVAGASKDQVAVDYIMGHVDATMAGVYRQEIQDDRLIAVAKVVHRWMRRG
jgi:integrase